jgi:hypothetical protein
MKFESVEKKLREAEIRLTKMREQEARAFGDKEPFDFYSSAFDYRLRHEHGETYKAWRKWWSNPKEAALIKFFADDRRSEVRERGSSRQVKQEAIPVRGHYSDESGTMLAFSVPLPLDVAHDVPPEERDAVIYKPPTSSRSTERSEKQRKLALTILRA